MRILAIEQENTEATPEQFQPFLKEEAARIWELYQAGALREIYFRADRSSAVLLLECTDGAEAARLLDSLPLVRNRLITFDLIPLKPYPGFARLFGEDRHGN